jgi:hypothetical protein
MVQQKSPISLERNRMHPTHPNAYMLLKYLSEGALRGLPFLQ